MQDDIHVFQGLKRDTHQINQDSKFLWDAHNVRLSNREDSTLYSITNEKGTYDTKVTFVGNYVGHCVIDKYLVVFTTTVKVNGEEDKSYIYRLENNNGTLTKALLYEGKLNIDTKHPIQTLGVYENNLIYKVYWIDGKNTPRLIIISLPENKGKPVSDNYTDLYKNFQFDFVTSLNLKEDVTITKHFGSGVFSPGTIQYALTYYNKYAQESNIFYTTPIHYISPSNRGGNPEEPVSNSFSIKVKEVDTNFEYLRVYSIHRSSLDEVPTVKQLPDVSLTNLTEDGVTVVDTGTTGIIVDPTKLIYVGGRDIIPQCFTSKDGTMFFGNIELVNKDLDVINLLKDNKESIINTRTQNVKHHERQAEVNSLSYYSSDGGTLDKEYYAGFKANEMYRLGIQAQLSNGVWTQPVHLGDKELTTKYPLLEDGNICQYTTKLTIDHSLLEELRGKGVKKLRTCVVFPSAYERDILCQGILNPTIYNAVSRSKNAPFAQSSWFFRPAMKQLETPEKGIFGGNIEYRSNYALKSTDYGTEIYSMTDTTDKRVEDASAASKQDYYVDENIVTLNSPDIEFGSFMQNNEVINAKLNILGYAELSSIFGDIDVRTSTPAHSLSGFIHKIVGYHSGTDDEYRNNGGLVSQYMYADTAVKRGDGDDDGKVVDAKYASKFMVCPFNREGSLNNDVARSAGDGTRTALLQKKVISNLKFFDTFHMFNDNVLEYDITPPQVFNDNEVSILKVDVDYLTEAGSPPISATYQGNVDTMLTHDKEYDIRCNSPLGDGIKTTTDPIRVKYKSSPHIMFRLKSNNSTTQTILPRHTSLFDDGTRGYVKYPAWMNDRDPITALPDEDTIEKLPNYNGSINVIGLNFDTDGMPDPDNRVYFCMYNQVPMVGKFKSNSPGSFEFINIEEEGEYIYKIESETKIYPDNTFLSLDIIKTSLEISEDDYRMVGDYLVLNNPMYVKHSPDSGRLVKLKITGSGATQDPTIITYNRGSFGNGSDNLRPYLLIAEIVNTSTEKNKFGGDSPQALAQNLWLPACKPVSIEIEPGKNLDIMYDYGDTWFSRYDCLKTYPFTKEDTNQIVEVGSFMCETRINIDGRYDKNKGILSNLNSSPTNFNLINTVYNQKDNFFTYRLLEEDDLKLNRFSNQITWTLQKTNAEPVDSWTNITLANTTDVDGSKGAINSLNTWNDHLLCFQDRAISEVLFNSRVQIPTSDGVPIEISNGYKVDGVRYINSNIGCNNKWSIAQTSSGIYFMEPETDALYIYTGELANLSAATGLSWWAREWDISNIWYPKAINSNGIRTFTDYKYGDLYFTPGPVSSGEQPEALCYSEQLAQFTSFMSYGGIQAMFNLNGDFYSLKNEDSNSLRLYKNNAGEYNNFYGTNIGWRISFISNNNPTVTKIFDTVELVTDHYSNNGISPLNTCPINFIKVDNEYQVAEAKIDNMNMRKKFRVWRGLIPRSPKVLNTNSYHLDQSKGVDTTRNSNLGRARIRNPWAMITLGWNEKHQRTNNKAMIHNVNVKYSI